MPTLSKDLKHQGTKEEKQRKTIKEEENENTSLIYRFSSPPHLARYFILLSLSSLVPSCLGGFILPLVVS